jgi:5-methylcytosine-specific restriction endonuclease McrA
MTVLTRVRWHFAYECYLSSRAWRRVRNGALMRAGLHCERCDKGGLLIGLEVHHRTYAHLGDERADELEALCAECHKQADRERRRTTRRGRWRR